jgi:hypothetical protein
MRIPKRYGQSRIDNCPFCGKQCTTKNKQGVPVCQDHKDDYLDNIRCVCGELLDVREGKWGPYFVCMDCGNINFKKAMEMNPQLKDKQKVKSESKDNHDKKKSYKTKQDNKREITVTSDQLDYLY